MISLQLPKNIEHQLEELAKKNGQTTEAYACEALIEYLEDLEDIRIAEYRLAHPGKRWSHEDVKKDLDLGD